MLTVECFTDPSVFASLREEWTALESRLSPRSPFAGVLWHETWWAHLRRRSWHARDDLAIYAVRNERRELVAVAPFMQTKRPGVGPVRVTEFHGLGADAYLTELRGLICEPGHLHAVMSALRAHFIGNRPRPTWATWYHVRWLEKEDGHAPPNEVQSSRYDWMRPRPSYVLDMPASWPEFEARLTRDFRKRVRYYDNVLERLPEKPKLRVVTEPGEVERAVERHFELIDLRSQVRNSNPFSRADVRGFYLDYAQRSATIGQLRVFEEVFEGKVVACRIGYALGQELYLHHSGNDPEWDRYSIMTVLVADILRWAVANKFHLVNLSTGHDRSKTRWRPREIMYVDAVEVMKGPVNKALYRAFDRINGAREPARKELFTVSGDQISLPSYQTVSEARKAANQ